MKAGRQAGTCTGPAMSLIVILGFAEVEQMSVALDAAMIVTRQVGRQAGSSLSQPAQACFHYHQMAACPSQHKLVPMIRQAGSSS